MRRGKRRFLVWMLVCAMLASLAVPAQAQGQALPPPDDNKAQEEWDALMDAVEAAREEMGLSSASGDSADPENGSDREAPETPSSSDSAQEGEEGQVVPPPSENPKTDEPEPSVEETFPVVTVPAENYSIVNVGFNNKSLFLRSAPGYSASRLLLPFATERAFVRETLSNGWSRVIVRGTEGYLPTEYVADNFFPLYLRRDYTADGTALSENQPVYARSRDGQNVYDCYTDANVSQHLLLNGALLMTPQEYYEKNRDKFIPVLIGREESYYSQSSANWGRNVNLELGCQSVDGLVVLPAEYFSWCEDGGSGSKADGYQLATVFSDSGYDYGGGLCQVTTTLASAANHAKMYLAEVYAHSRPVTYLREGMTEASIWHNGNIVYQHDFTFFNNRMNPVRINMKAENGVVTAELYELVLPPETQEPAFGEPAETETTQTKDEAQQ